MARNWCVTKEGVKLEETDDEKVCEDKATQFEDLCKTVKEVLGDKVEKVVVSIRITDLLCILVTSQFGWSANMVVFLCHSCHILN